MLCKIRWYSTPHYRFKQSISDWGINLSSSCDCELFESKNYYKNKIK